MVESEVGLIKGENFAQKVNLLHETILENTKVRPNFMEPCSRVNPCNIPCHVIWEFA